MSSVCHRSMLSTFDSTRKRRKCKRHFRHTNTPRVLELFAWKLGQLPAIVRGYMCRRTFGTEDQIYCISCSALIKSFMFTIKYKYVICFRIYKAEYLLTFTCICFLIIIFIAEIQWI